jgi:hypothetical protein
MSVRVRNLVVISAALLSFGVPSLMASTAAAQPVGTAVTRRIRSHSPYTEPISSVDAADCRGLAGPSPQCGSTVVGPTYFTGTMHGTVHYEERGWLRPDGKLGYEGPDYFTGGGIVGCGDGEFVVDTFDGWVDLTQWDPATNSAPGFNRWRVRPQSGTRGLTGLIGGAGENHWRMYFSDTGTQKWGKGLYTGTVTCQVPAR